MYSSTLPRLGDSDNVLLGKILERLGGLASSASFDNTLLFKILVQLNSASGSAADARYMLKSGDTMTGALTAQTISSTTGNFTITTDDSATTFAYQEVFRKRGTTGDVTAAVTINSELGGISFQGWNGSAYVTCAQFIGRAAQNQSVGNSGGHLQINTTPVGSASALARMFVTAQGNVVLGNVTTTEPTNLLAGVVWKDTTAAATADPTTGAAVWSVSGSLQYRTSGASEGSGQTNSLHNRAAEQAGVGSNYTLTNSTAQVAFGTTNAAVTLPTAGTYYIQANVSIINGATADDIYDAKLRNTTDSVDIGVNKKVSGGPASGRVNILLTGLVTIAAASKVVSIFAFNETAARGTVESTTTDIRYVRLS